LVLLSVGVAIIGSLTALALTALSNTNDTTAGQRTFALVSGGLIMGATIWSMHFVAMMAVDFPVLVTYNAAETFSSIGIAIGATGTGLFLASVRPVGWFSIPAGGVLMGLGIAGMHYLGMSAIRGCGLDYDYRLVAASIAIAIFASMAALWFAFFKRNVLMTVAGGVVQGLAIASMHYTAMAATYFVPMGADIEISAPLLSQSHMAYMIACGIVLMSAVNLAFVALMTREPA
jgi:NO-binding membrane sensor protein with MHYT domain